MMEILSNLQKFEKPIHFLKPKNIYIYIFVLSMWKLTLGYHRMQHTHGG